MVAIFTTPPQPVYPLNQMSDFTTAYGRGVTACITSDVDVGFFMTQRFPQIQTQARGCL